MWILLKGSGEDRVELSPSSPLSQHQALIVGFRSSTQPTQVKVFMPNIKRIALCAPHLPHGMIARILFFLQN